MRAYTENADLGGTDTNEVACATKPDQPDMTYEAHWSGKEVTVTIQNPKTHPIENSRVNVTITSKDKKGSANKTVLEFTSTTTHLPFTFENLNPNQNYDIEAVVILTVDGYGPIVSKAAVESFTATWVILYIGIGVAAGLLAIIVAIVVLIYRNPTAREAIREKREAFGKRRPTMTTTTTKKTTTTTAADRRATPNDNNNENIYENGAVSLVDFSHPIQMDDFDARYREMTRDSNLEFSAQFDDLKPVGKEETMNVAKSPENKHKNRSVVVFFL